MGSTSAIDRYQDLRFRWVVLITGSLTMVLVVSAEVGVQEGWLPESIGSAVVLLLPMIVMTAFVVNLTGDDDE